MLIATARGVSAALRRVHRGIGLIRIHAIEDSHMVNYPMRVRRFILLTSSITLLGVSVGVLAMSEENLRLRPCPQSPNCVSSDVPPQAAKYIAPFVSSDAGEASSLTAAQPLLAAIATYMGSRKEFHIVERSDRVLRVEAKSRLLGFVDDIDLQARGDRVFVRSASRVGYSDLGKNRRRLETMRRVLTEQGLLQP